MNHNLQTEVGFWVDALIKWQPDMSVKGSLDFYQNVAKPKWIDVYKKTILELRANRYDGLANALEARFEVFQKDVIEREKKRYAEDKDQPVFDRILSGYKITKPAYARSSDIFLAFTHIGLSKQHLIDVLKKIARLPEMSGTGKAGAREKIEGKWSKPMSKAAIMQKLSLGIKGYKKLNTITKEHTILPSGESPKRCQTWTIRYDKMPPNWQEKFK
jgi:hypothetical protein